MTDPCTNIETLRRADWDELERDVVTRIRALKAVAAGLEPDAASDRIANELMLPALELLAEFCTSVDVKPTAA